MPSTQIASIRISETDGTRYLVAILQDDNFEHTERVFIDDLDADADMSSAISDLFDALELLV